MSKRKFFKTVVKVTVLSEDVAPEFDDLDDLKRLIEDGPCSGEVTVVETKRLTGAQTARALMRQGSCPSFFQLNRKGEDLEQ